MQLRFNDSSPRAAESAARLAAELASLGEHPHIASTDGKVTQTFFFRVNPADPFVSVEVKISTDGELSVRLGHNEFKPDAGYFNGTLVVTDGETAVLRTTGMIGDLEVRGDFGWVPVHTWIGGYAEARDADVERALHSAPTMEDEESFNF